MGSRFLQYPRLFDSSLAKCGWSIALKGQVRNAGHSHWQNIKGTKMAADAAKSRMYNKYINQIKIAVWRGGGKLDPVVNDRLAAVIRSARKDQMSQDTINNVLKKLKDSKENAKPLYFEVKGPKGVGIIVQLLAHKATQATNLFKGTIRRCKSLQLCNNGSLMHLFKHKGIVLTEPPVDIPDIVDKSIEHAIEVGAEEVAPSQEDPKQLEFLCDPEEVNKVATKLQKLNYNIIKAEEDFIPLQYVELSEDEMNELSSQLEKIEEIPEVVKIYDNIS